MGKPYQLKFWQQWCTNTPQGSIIAGHPDTIQLKDIPADVPMDDATLTFWNGDKFESIDQWPPYTQLPPEPRIDPNATRLGATCGVTPVELRRDGGRWLMWVGKPPWRRKDFASPFMEHAQRTAVAWYGEPTKDWQALDVVSRKPPGRASESTQDLPIEDEPLP
jgi:hypothetical protein